MNLLRYFSDAPVQTYWLTLTSSVGRAQIQPHLYLSPLEGLAGGLELQRAISARHDGRSQQPVK